MIAQNDALDEHKKLCYRIPQNDALDEHKKLCYRKNFLADRKNGPWGPKMAIFGQKLQVLAKNGDF